MLTLIVLLNVFDAVSTAVLYSLGKIYEVNIIWCWLLEYSTVLFVLTKVVLVTLCVAILWRYSTNKLSILVAWVAAIVYLSVLLVHLFGLFHLLI